MPNTPVAVQNGVTIHTAGTNVQEADRQLLSEMLSSVGIGMEMQEHYMDIMTALSGGGPSFVSASRPIHSHSTSAEDTNT